MKHYFRLAAILQYFDTGVCLTKIKNEKDAGGDIETHHTSYGAYKKANAKYIIVKNGRLADVAPSILHIMGLEQPADMTGENLIEDNK